VNENWERQKIAEKGRTSVADGVPLAQPSLALAAKLVSRAGRAGLDPVFQAEDEIGGRLFAVVQDAVAAGIDPEGALRRTTRRYLEALRAAESEVAT
jgi:XTP/dITP diphosphohydrolase